jgi:hypothetical protein
MVSSISAAGSAQGLVHASTLEQAYQRGAAERLRERVGDELPSKPPRMCCATYRPAQYEELH